MKTKEEKIMEKIKLKESDIKRHGNGFMSKWLEYYFVKINGYNQVDVYNNSGNYLHSEEVH